MADLICYRGEQHNRWGLPTLRLNDGLTVRDPLPGGELPKIRPADVRNSLALKIRTLIQASRKVETGAISKKDVADYAQALRKEGQTYAIATARDKGGAFDMAYSSFYTIVIPSARTFRWGENLTLGKEEDWVTTTDVITEEYIVLNAPSIEKSTVLGFGHKTGTWEVTFFTDLPTNWVKKVDGKDVSEVKIKKKSAFDEEDRRLMQKLVRPRGRWVDTAGAGDIHAVARY
ncbi:hypothetical protein [Amycolatopsis panacis]|uniref:hypothetical protein n=1 Tax=Amycolatopsis panacis TaxID=2340917 RepID=UPI0011C39BDA|nr:hypothetical protein [Amycolatopsis panacis]